MMVIYKDDANLEKKTDPAQIFRKGQNPMLYGSEPIGLGGVKHRVSVEPIRLVKTKIVSLQPVTCNKRQDEYVK